MKYTALLVLAALLSTTEGIRVNSFEEPAADPTVEPTEGPAKGEKA